MSKELTIDDTYGYHIIDTPEKKAKFAPVKSTDEWNPNLVCGWVPTIRKVGEHFSTDSGDVYRRPINVGPGNVLVGLDEVIGNDCQSTEDGEDWVPHTWGGRTTVRDALAICWGNPTYVKPIAFRRKTASADGWVKISDRLPRADEYPVWVTDGKEVEAAHEQYPGVNGGPCTPEECRSCTWDYSITHWQPKPKEVKPQPPAPEQSEEDRAFEKAVARANIHSSPCESFRMIWSAAIAFARAKEGK